MRRDTGCHSLDHAISRRGLLVGAAAGTAALGMLRPAQANELGRSQKRLLQVYLQGGVSQFESWDPKPGTRHGGPFRAIPTSVPGIHISELLPHTAQRMHLLSLIRSINLRTNDHGHGRLFMEKGRNNGDYPYIGSVASIIRTLDPEIAYWKGITMPLIFPFPSSLYMMW